MAAKPQRRTARESETNYCVLHRECSRVYVPGGLLVYFPWCLADSRPATAAASLSAGVQRFRAQPHWTSAVRHCRDFSAVDERAPPWCGQATGKAEGSAAVRRRPELPLRWLAAALPAGAA
eukprot:GHVT01011676.1.p3 GENE.GHVT01011676.1~~GHVT01011676.1.p3  ORF type:complete len:121 (+),score=28.64 GHVT01011676.1:1230-1592(+)